HDRPVDSEARIDAAVREVPNDGQLNTVVRESGRRGDHDPAIRLDRQAARLAPVSDRRDDGPGAAEAGVERAAGRETGGGKVVAADGQGERAPRGGRGGSPDGPPRPEARVGPAAPRVPADREDTLVLRGPGYARHDQLAVRLLGERRIAASAARERCQNTPAR